jgi:ornithine decarboxylase
MQRDAVALAPMDDRVAQSVEPYLLGLIEESLAYPTPAFWMSAARIRENYCRFRLGLPGVRVFFPVKTNPHPEVLRVLAPEGSSFDAASWGEIESLRGLGVAPDRIAFTTPIKPIEEVRQARDAGIDIFVADCPTEIEKLASAAPGCKVLVRMQTPNTGSQWPLSRRFGGEPERVPALLEQAARAGLIPYGLTFHVGSQCTRVENWIESLIRCSRVIEDFERRTGERLALLNIGGGFPVRYTVDTPPLEAILSEIRTTFQQLFSRSGLQLWVEPGRAVVGDAAVAVTTVIGTALRGRRRWLFCDLGAFNGLLELIEPSSRGFRYPVVACTSDGNSAVSRRYILAGPSCDGDDVLSAAVELPELGLGDRIAFLRAGAYSFAYCSAFCGNRRPEVYVR